MGLVASFLPYYSTKQVCVERLGRWLCSWLFKLVNVKGLAMSLGPATVPSKCTLRKGLRGFRWQSKGES